MAPLSMASGTLRAFPVQSALTILAMAVGVLGVSVALASIGTIERSFAIFDKGRLFSVELVHPSRGTSPPAPITLEQGRAVAQAVDLSTSLQQVLAIGSVSMRTQRTSASVRILGVGGDWPLHYGYQLAEGRYLVDHHLQVGTPHVVLGWDVAQSVAPYSDPVGRRVSIAGYTARVVGVYASKGKLLGVSRDNFVSVSIDVAERWGLSRGSGVELRLLTEQPESSGLQFDRATQELRVLRRLPPESATDFTFVPEGTLTEEVARYVTGLSIVAAAVGIIMLVLASVGLIGTITLSALARKREFGIRRAVGATASSIRAQVILESWLMCQVGGAVGIAGALAVTAVVGNLTGLDLQLRPLSIAIVVLLMTICAAMMCQLPAKTAASMQPADVLKAE